jgi:hypothetical protein
LKFILCRTIPDYRPSACSKDDQRKDDFAKASVIISFYDEARSALLRTVVSVLQRTPDSLLKVRKDSCRGYTATIKTPIPKCRLYWSYLDGDGVAILLGSESGQKQIVKLLQNMAYNTTQHPPPYPTPLQQYTVFGKGGGRGWSERRYRGNSTQV